jgi:hypothetical protein
MDAISGCPIDKHHGANNCRWARSTLALAGLLWLDAEACPWSCLRDGAPRLLSTTGPCSTCLRWEPHPTAPRADNRKQKRPTSDSMTIVPGGFA